MDAELKEMFKVVLDLQAASQRAITDLTVSVGKFVAASDAYVAVSNARMKRLEENLDGLIRAITREHSNGKKGHE